MGVKDLTKQLQKLAPDAFKACSPMYCAVLIDELMLRIYKYASMDFEVEMEELLGFLCGDYIKFFQSSECSILVVVADDIKYVPRQKIAEQEKRRKSASRDPYPKTMSLLPSVIKDEKGEWTMVEGGIRDEVRGTKQGTVCPQRLMVTGHMRAQLVRQTFMYLAHILDLPSHNRIFFDMGLGDITFRYGKNVMVMPRDVLYNTIGEGEIKAVWWYMRLRDSLDLPAQMNFQIKTKDLDIIPILLFMCWDIASQKNGLVCVNNKFGYVDIKVLFATLKAAGWRQELLIGACILSGTDYSEKKHMSDQIGLDLMWKTWDTYKGALLSKIDVSASYITPCRYQALRGLFEEMVKINFACTRKQDACVSPLTVTWAELSRALFLRRIKAPPSIGSRPFNTGLCEFVWLWVYWGSLSAVVTDLIRCRGEVNEASLESGYLKRGPPKKDSCAVCRAGGDEKKAMIMPIVADVSLSPVDALPDTVFKATGNAGSIKFAASINEVLIKVPGHNLANLREYLRIISEAAKTLNAVRFSARQYATLCKRPPRGSSVSAAGAFAFSRAAASTEFEESVQELVKLTMEYDNRGADHQNVGMCVSVAGGGVDPQCATMMVPGGSPSAEGGGGMRISTEGDEAMGCEGSSGDAGGGGINVGTGTEPAIDAMD